MSKNLRTEDFVIHVAKTIEKQLKEWDPKYEVLLLKMEDYILVVKKNDDDVSVTISETECQILKDHSPYALDRKIWQDLYLQGIPLYDGPGNYMQYVFGQYY